MSDWWSRHLGGNSRPAEPEAPLSAWWAPPPPPAPVAAQPGPPAPGPAQVTLPAPGAPRPQYLTATGQCPQCGGENYMRPTPTTKPRCYGCGWPVVHSTSGVSIPAGTPVAGAARQLEASRRGDFRPQHIVGRVGVSSD